MATKCPKCHSDNPDDSVYCGKCATPLPLSRDIPVTKTLETPTDKLASGTTFAGRYEIIEELGKKRKAIEHYQNFLDLWKDADPGIAEVEDAKKRLAGLKGE